jgi:hypothetical protein
MIQQDSERVAQRNLLNPRPIIQVLYYCTPSVVSPLVLRIFLASYYHPKQCLRRAGNFFEPQGPRHLFPNQFLPFVCNDNKQTPCAVLLPQANIQRDENKETSLCTIYVLLLQVFPVRLSYHTTTTTSISVVSDKNQENKHPQVSIENQASDRSSSYNLPPNRRGEMRDVFAISISCPYMYLF